MNILCFQQVAKILCQTFVGFPIDKYKLRIFLPPSKILLSS